MCVWVIRLQIVDDAFSFATRYNLKQIFYDKKIAKKKSNTFLVNDPETIHIYNLIFNRKPSRSV